MSCRYCSQPVAATEESTCSPCGELVSRRMWGLLALTWLAERPEDWVPDVAAFLEHTEGQFVS